MAFDSLIGCKFGKLTVIGRAENTKQGKAKWLCRCDCGKAKQKSVTSNDLKSGKVKSCGCLRSEGNKGKNKKHGLTNSRLFRIWSSMKRRCNCTNIYTYKNYGSKGIKVCEEWLDFQAFYDWAMANGYADKLSIDGINNDGNYEPSNCRWVDMKVQENNRTNNRVVNYSGNKYTVSELADLLSIPYATLLYRINSGWKDRELSLTPSLNNKNIRRYI